MDSTPEVTSSHPISRGYVIPGYLLGLYALLLFALGWLGHQRWQEFRQTAYPPSHRIVTHPHHTATLPASAVPTPPAPSADNGELPAFTYSAHVFTSEPERRSITLNNQRYHEGDSPFSGVVIEQIQQDVTVFSVNGDPFIQDALEDWPGGKPESSEKKSSLP
ncbi:type II secretion system assembly factor GspB [Lonsdalea britannica]|uniref:type II secretion system assembly factor GspB n=1 Tax=Lonsdalea britannica TaxID=1082704 RepID=UPI0026F0AEBE|nr:type II secretion system assembly factor GspB [Lonsdalea britannica]